MIVGALVGISAIMVLMGVPSGVPDAFSVTRSLWALLVCLPMGVQNAVTTLTSVGRTTHVTGTLTDLGIAIANRTHRTTIHLSCRWAGFAFGGSAGLLTFVYIPSLFAQLAILTIVIIITGSFYAHPAVVRKLSPVISMRGHRPDNM